MSKVFLVAKREFGQRVRTRGFILSSIFVPVILLVVMLTGSFSGEFAVVESEEAPAGEETTDESAAEPDSVATSNIVAYVDEAGLIERTPENRPEEYRAFTNLDAAAAALAEGEIESYYVIAADYRETGNVRRVTAELPATPPETGAFDWLLRTNLLPAATLTEVSRAQNPFQSFQLPVQTVSGETEATTGNGFFNMMPFLVAMLVMIPLFTSGSYLLQSLTEEKSGRVMEILLVSLRPPALLAGKLLGLGALTMVQYAIWLTLGAGVLLIVGQDVTGLLGAINLTTQELVLVLLFALGGYALYATLMAGLGALSPNLEATRSWVFVITLPMMIPIYLWVVISGSPQGALAVGLSLFPFSAPIAMLMRLASATVPVWQVIASLALLGVTAAFMVWLMSRLFRVQTLLSGEAFSVRRFWSAVREG